MKLFLDTEFTSLTQDAKLISLAIVSESGNWFYAEFSDLNIAELSDWHRQHILPQLTLGKGSWMDAVNDGQYVFGSTETIKAALLHWLKRFDQVEIWADVLAYDWLLFCEIFGGAMNLPAQIFYIPFDLSTLLKWRNIEPDIARESLVEEWQAPFLLEKHHALYDAFLGLAIYEKMEKEK